MANSIDFTVNGKRYRLSRDQVVMKMRGVTPERVAKHAVQVNGVKYPVKQVFSRVTGIDRLDFTSQVARRHLANLGFALERL